MSKGILGFQIAGCDMRMILSLTKREHRALCQQILLKEQGVAHGFALILHAEGQKARMFSVRIIWLMFCRS